jgi:hypothetical protein
MGWYFHQQAVVLAVLNVAGLSLLLAAFVSALLDRFFK